MVIVFRTVYKAKSTCFPYLEWDEKRRRIYTYLFRLLRLPETSGVTFLPTYLLIIQSISFFLVNITLENVPSLNRFHTLFLRWTNTREWTSSSRETSLWFLGNDH